MVKEPALKKKLIEGEKKIFKGLINIASMCQINKNHGESWPILAS